MGRSCTMLRLGDSFSLTMPIWMFEERVFEGESSLGDKNRQGGRGISNSDRDRDKMPLLPV